MLTNLVYGINDTVRGMAYNPADGWLYFLSDDRANNKVYLSAVSFDWGSLGANSIATYQSANPDSTNTYLGISYDSGDSYPDLNRGDALAFSPDGSVLYVVVFSTTGANSRVFIFDRYRPPAKGTVVMIR
jgi:hypothetical protein